MGKLSSHYLKNINGGHVTCLPPWLLASFFPSSPSLPLLMPCLFPKRTCRILQKVQRQKEDKSLLFLFRNWKGKLDERKVNIPIIQVIVCPLKEPRNLSHSYRVSKLCSKTREMLDEKNTISISRGRQKLSLSPTLKCIFLWHTMWIKNNECCNSHCL